MTFLLGDPPELEAMVGPDGRVNRAWSEWLQALQQLAVADAAAAASASAAAAAAATAATLAAKSYSFTSRGVGAGTYYAAGFLEAPTTDSNLTQASTTQTLGNANVPYAAHAFLVASGPGAADGGTGAVTLVVSGTSITDAGVRTASDSEVIASNVAALTANQYLETTKKWLGQVTYTLTVGGTGHTTYNADFNYGFCKYDDFGNRDFTLTDFEVVGLAAANSTWNVELLHHTTTGWTYAATGFVPGGTALVDADVLHSTENDLDNALPFAVKRVGMTQAVLGATYEGFIIRITTGQNNSVQFMDMHVKAMFTA